MQVSFEHVNFMPGLEQIGHQLKASLIRPALPHASAGQPPKCQPGSRILFSSASPFRSGINTRRRRGALAALLRGAPLSKHAV
jgi:hypothetical protein